MKNDANQTQAEEQGIVKKYFLISQEDDEKLREVVNRIRKEEGCRLTQVGWLRRKIEEEHAGLGNPEVYRGEEIEHPL